MRRCRRLLVAVGLSLAFVTATGGPAAAHPLGNFTVNHFSGIEVFPDRVVIHYVVDMAEIPTFQELPLMDANNDDNVSSSELQSFAYDTGAGVLTNLSLLSDGQRVELRLDDARARFRRGQGGLNILRVEATLHGLLNESAATLTYEDRNYPARLGWKEIVAYGSGGQGIVSSSVPSESVSDELRSYPNNLLSSPLEVTEATVRVAPGAAPRSADARSGTPAAAETDFITAAFASLIEEKFSPGFFSVALALAIGAGALHALGPGHGKTVMAAYLVGTQGRARHALSVGVAISLMHTTSVVVLGLITLLASSLFPPESVYPWLSLASGVVVLCLGASLLRSRLRSRKHPAGSDDGNAQHHEHSHVHPAHEHQHSHDHGRPHSHGLGPHDHGPRNRAHESPLSWRGLVALGLSGGLLPSPTALVVLLGAVALHRIAFGVALVAAFSVGLAGALTLMGLVVLRARSYAAARLSGSSMSLLPIGSAALILAIGLFLTTRAALGL
jgi:nickel/cobalt exporter